MKQSWYISAYALFLIFVITRVNIVNSNETLNIVGSKFFQNTKQSILDKTHNKENRSNVFTNQVYLPDVKNTLLFRKADSVTDKTKVANKNTEEIKVTDSHVTQDPKNQASNSNSANTNKLNSNSKTNNDSNSNKVFIDANNKDNKSQAQTRVAYGGFFDTLSKNSKENENMAWKALATFLGGIACFFISIHVTCWNERRAVKEVEFTDWIAKAERCGIISNGVETEKIESSKSYIVSGELQLQQTARIPDLNIDFTYGANRHAIIKYEVEHFTIYDSSVTETNSDGESYNRPVTTKQWAPYFEGQNEKLKTRILTGTGLISGKYKVNLEKLSHLVESHQTRDIADNKYIHVFKQSDEQLLLDYFKKDSNTDLEIKVIVDNQYAYIIRKDASKINRDSFKSSTYDFSVEDRRIKIKYFYPDPNFQATAVGRVVPGKEPDTYEMTPFETNLKKAGCHYFCCCCAESEETYKVDLLYEGIKDRDAIVDQLKSENDACTCGLRLLGFLLHFAAYYGMLYPLIMLVGMIPYIGAVGATILIFIAFFLALISFLFLIACAWICARPFLAIFIFAIIGVLIFTGKEAQEKLKENGTIQEEPSRSMSSSIVSRASVTANQKFLGF